METAVILAGGEGTRLRPLTFEIPKSLIPIQGLPLIEHLIYFLKYNKVKNIIISIGYLGDKIKKKIGNGEKYDTNIFYAEEKEPLGTAGPIKLAFKKYPHLLKNDFIVTNGDNLIDIDIFRIYKFHKNKKVIATLALTEVQDITQYGVVEINEGYITNFLEKPTKEQTNSNLINAGFYIINKQICDYIKDGFSMLEKDIFPLLTKERKIAGYKHRGQWFDTGTFERWGAAINNWKNPVKHLKEKKEKLQEYDIFKVDKHGVNLDSFA